MKYLILLLLLLPTTDGMKEYNVIKIINFDKHSDLHTFDGIAYLPNIIITNGVDEMYRRTLAHELRHHICFRLFNNFDYEHERCFIN